MLDLGAIVVEQGLIFALMTLGVYITYKILDFPDLSVDGTITLGAFIAAFFITKNYNPIFATIVASIGGAVAGMITGILHVHLKITNLLSGILVMIGLYSINLRITGKANVHLFGKRNVFNMFDQIFPDGSFFKNYSSIILMFIIIVIVKIGLDFFLKTKLGMVLRTTGKNPTLVTSLGVNIGLIKIIGLMLSNGLVAFAGALLAQNQSFVDINMGIGMIVVGLASVIIGEAVLGRLRWLTITTMVIMGTLLYRMSTLISLQYGFHPGDLKLITTLLVITALGINNHIKKIPFKRKEKLC